MRPLLVCTVVLSGFACAGLDGPDAAPPVSPPPSDPSEVPGPLAVILTADGERCAVGFLELDSARARPITHLPGSCQDEELLVDRDGTRLGLPGPHAAVVDLRDGQTRRLPPIRIDENDVTRDLHLARDGGLLMDFSWGEGEPTVGEGLTWPTTVRRVYTLEGRVWQERATARVGDGATDGSAYSAAMATVNEERLSAADLLEGAEGADEALAATLEAASGESPDRWFFAGPVAHAATDASEAGYLAEDPVLVRVDEQWKVVSPGTGSLRLAQQDRWLIVARAAGTTVIDTRRGEEVWTGAAAWFWPTAVPRAEWVPTGTGGGVR